VARDPVGVGAGPLALEGATVFVANPRTGVLVRIGPAGRRVLTLGGSPVSLSSAPGRLWVAERDSGQVVSLDSTTLRQVTVSAIPVPVSVMAGPLGVWTISLDAASLYSLDPASGAAVALYDAPVRSPVDMVAVGQEIWVLGAGEGGLSPFNAGLGRVVRSGFDLPGQSVSGLAASADTIWLGQTGEHSLVRVEAASVAVSRLPLAGGIEPIALSLGPCGLWVAGAAGELALVDPRTGAPLAVPIRLGAATAAVAASGTGAWVTDPADGTLLHVGLSEGR
jgi:hypothetical protein